MSQRGKGKKARKLSIVFGNTEVTGELRESSFGAIVLVEAGL